MIWSDRVLLKLGREPRIGDWYAPCCVLDLSRIDDADDLEWIHESVDDLGVMLWPTLAAALADLEDDSREAGPEEAARWQQLFATLAN